MKIEKISDNKIKIELTENEITSWSNVANTRIPDYNAMIVDLISAAEKETGVSFRNCKVIVEATQSHEGKYVVFVSREAKKQSAHRIKDKTYRPGNVNSTHIVVEFEDIESICAFDRHYPFYATMLKGSNSLYSYKDFYYLEIDIPQNFSRYSAALRGNISEFSSHTGGTVIPYLLAEHARCLLRGNALLELRKMN